MGLLSGVFLLIGGPDYYLVLDCDPPFPPVAGCARLLIAASVCQVIFRAATTRLDRRG